MQIETPIATSIREDSRTSWIAFITAIAFVFADLLMCHWNLASRWWHFLLAGVGAISMSWLSGFDRKTLGLVLHPIQGYSYWAKAGVVIGAVVLGFCFLAMAVIKAIGFSLPLPMLPPDQVTSFLLHYCVLSPIIEESLYRLVLCLPLVALIGSRFTVLAGGAVFTVAHFVGGNPGVDNFIAGFFLCWAYLKSGSLLVPLAFHSVGNAFAVVAQLFNWTLTHSVQ